MRLRQMPFLNAKIAVCAVAAAAIGALLPQTAYAAGANWGQYSGNCYGWTTWDASYVTGHVWDHANDTCSVTIFQYKSNELPEWPDSSSTAYASATNTGNNTPTWYHGAALYDYVCVEDETLNSPIECSPTYT